MSNALNVSKLGSLAAHITNLIGLSNSKASIDAVIAPGIVFDYAGTAPPAGYLLCAGQAVSRTTYAALFTAIGTTHGAGDGSTTFNLPDLRGRVSAGKDDMGGTAANRLTTGGSGVNGASLGASGGADTHTLTVAQMPSHSHAIHFKNAGTAGSGSGLMRSNAGTDDGASQSFADSTGSGTAHNNTQPTIVLNKIIKT